MSSRDRQSLVNAYRELAHGSPDMLIGLLDQEVEWRDARSTTQVVRGREAVSDLIATLASDAKEIGLRGITVRGERLTFAFDVPWWKPRRGWSSLAVRLLSGSFVQVVTYDASVRQIENRIELISPELAAEQDSYVALMSARF